MSGVATLYGFKLYHYDIVESTNELAKELAPSLKPYNSIILANEQTRGKGRKGRSWISPPGNLYVSLLHFDRQEIADLPQFSLISCIALGEALLSLDSNLNVMYKWPNDILVTGNKIAGVLLESSISSNGKVEWFIVGIGVNIISSPDNALIDWPASNLYNMSDKKTFLKVFLKFYMQYVEKWQNEGGAFIRDHWLKRAFGLYEECYVTTATGKIRAVITGMSERGELIIITKEGRQEYLAVGDILFN